MVIELSVVQFWSEIILVISNRTRAARSFDFEITRMISDQIALHSVQLPLFISIPFSFIVPVADLCCKPKYRANSIHHFIFVLFLYFFYHSSGGKDPSLLFGKQCFFFFLGRFSRRSKCKRHLLAPKTQVFESGP